MATGERPDPQRGRRLCPPDLRSLDAIYLARAHELGNELGTLVTYDERMVVAAKQLGYKVASRADVIRPGSELPRAEFRIDNAPIRISLDRATAARV